MPSPSGPLTPAAYDLQGDQVVAAEEAAAAAATAELRSQLATLAAGFAVLAVLSDEDRARLSDELRRIDTDKLAGILRRSFGEAADLGSLHARIQIRSSVKARLTAEIREAAAAAPGRARVRLTAAGVLARGGADVDTVLAVAGRAVTETEATARWGVNAAHAAAIRQASDKAGYGRLWIAERDACVHCIAYAGHIAQHGTDFPGGLTYGKKPIVPAGETVTDPPLHPRCRCRTVAWAPEWPVDYAEALKREARRSVARGFSLESESEKTRLDAAARLLAQGPTLPKSVIEYAERSVKKGRFGRGRRFPGA